MPRLVTSYIVSWWPRWYAMVLNAETR